MSAHESQTSAGAAPTARFGREADVRLRGLVEHVRLEFGPPLASILGMTELLVDSGLSGEQSEYAHVIQSAAETINTLLLGLDDLFLTDALPGLGGEQDFDLRILVDDLAEQLRLHFTRKNTDFTVKVDDDVTSQVRGFPGALRHLALACLTQALTRPGSATAAMHVFVDHRDGARIELCLEIVLSGSAPGTGDGMSPLCQSLAGRLHGQCGVDNQADGRVRYWITAPVEEVAAPAPSFPAPVAIKGRSILVVDRDRNWREVLREYSYLWGCHFEEAATGGQALELLRSKADGGGFFDFVLTDSLLDDMDAQGFAAAVRKEPHLSAVRLVVLTSSARPGDARIMEKAGFAGYLTKPVSRRHLHDTLALVLAASAGEQPTALVTKHIVAEERKRRKMVLVVDDNETNRKLMTLMLTKGGYSFAVASSGEEALALLADTVFSLVLMDIQMPGINGFEAARIIRDSTSAVLDHDVPVIALTANRIDGSKDEYVNAGFDDILEKPFDFEFFFSLLEKHADREDTRGKPAHVVLDVSRLLVQLDNDRDLFEEVMRTFVLEGTERLAEYEAAVLADDFAMAEQKAHALRGMAGNIRAEGVRLLAEIAEQACRRMNRDKSLSVARDIAAEMKQVERAVALA